MAPVVLAEPIVPGLMSSQLTPELKGRVLLEELNCAACHQSEAPFAAQSKKAPRLAEIGSRVDPGYIESFILDPHGTQPGTTMPDVLTHLDGKERREVARAITHYLLSLKKNDFKPQAPDTVAARRGERLFHTRGCVACHSPRDQAGMELLPKTSAPLGALEKKYSTKSLMAFLQNPHASRPSGRMPDLKLPATEIESITHYLLRDTQVPGNLNYTLYHGLVWEGLHSEAVTARKAGQVNDFSLDQLGKQPKHFAVEYEGWMHIDQPGDYTFFLELNGGALRLDGTQVILQEPSQRRGPKKLQGTIALETGWRKIQLTYFNTGHKPVFAFEMKGPGMQRGPLSAAMLSVSNKPVAAFQAVRVDDALTARGRKYFETQRCANCHDDVGVAPQPARPFAELASGQGCLSEAPGNWPHFSLSAAQRQTITEALPKAKGELTDKQKIDKTLITYNCIACHDRAGLGGIVSERNAYFSGTHPELGDQGRLPPPLSHVGAKLQPAWISKVLMGGARQREYLHTRMPQYGEENVAHLVMLFGEVDQLENVTFPEIADIRESKNAGYEMIGSKGFSCIACHDFNGKNTGGAGALDLVHVTEHVQKNWFHLFMQNPSRFHTTGIMPSYWPGGQSIRPDVLNGDTAQQIEALWAYLGDGASAKKPEGLSRQSNELRVFDVPEIARGRGTTAGFRGIGVGYPGRLNLAFDSGEMALRLLWKNRFASVDHGSFKAAGDQRIAFPPGIPFHRLKSLDDHWPYKGKSDHLFPHDHGYQFLGYRLDTRRRPTFRYRYGDVAVDDFFEEVVDPDGVTKFRRTFKFEAGQAQSMFYFRAASGKKITRKSDRDWVVDRLQIRITSDHKAIIREGDPGEVLIPLTLPKGASSFTLEYIW